MSHIVMSPMKDSRQQTGAMPEMEGSGDIEVRIQEWSGKATELVIPKNSFGIFKIKE